MATHRRGSVCASTHADMPAAFSGRRAFLSRAGALAAAAVLGGCAGAPPPDDSAALLRADLIRAARAQIGKTVSYDPAYQPIAYPMGDIARSRGVCTDVVVRAYRDATGQDLQALLHEDMSRAFSAYPTVWGRSEPDPNIDHRRVLNIETFLTRRGARLPTPEGEAAARAFEPGDLVTWRISGAEPHIGIVSDRVDPRSGRLMVIHNFASGTLEEDFLWVRPFAGRFRPDWPVAA